MQRANRAIAASWKERLGRVRPHAIDLGLAVVVAAAVAFAISASSYSSPSTRPPDVLAVALYTAAAASRLRWSLGVAALYLAGLLLYALVWYPGPPGPVLNELVRDGALLAAVLLFGDAVRSRRALMGGPTAHVRGSFERSSRREERWTIRVGK